ncbi:MAG: mycothiol system anti-sigma-R factor [Candidatus Nanopelagicales bacterium]|jgi:mycothiol system anti-sigma-R factor
MSCGNPHATPCTEVLSLLYVYIDDEIDEVHRIEVTAHLGECPPCVEHFSVERRLKARVRDACLAEQVPEQVRSRIIAQIQQVSITYRYE